MSYESNPYDTSGGISNIDLSLGSGDGWFDFGNIDWGDLAMDIIGGAAQGAIIGDQGTKSVKVAQEQNRGALERLNDAQAFEQFLLDRRNVAGGPAYGGAVITPDFWFGLGAQEAGVADFFSSMNSSTQFTGGTGNVSRAPDTASYMAAGQGDVNAPLDFGVRDEYDNPLYNLRNLLGLDTRRGYAPDGGRANAPEAGQPGPTGSYLLRPGGG